MVSLHNYDEDLVLGFIEEFQDFIGLTEPIPYACVYRSADFPDERFVFRLAVSDDQHFALKIDTASGPDGRLARDYQTLVNLKPHFDAQENTAVVTPIYMSPSHKFYVTEYVDHKTAKQHIYNSDNDQQVAQIYRRGGQWLHALHASSEITRTNFWYNWMFEEIDAQLTQNTPMAPQADCKSMLGHLEHEIRQIAERQDISTFSHGDFHGGNLIMARGITIGMDFTEATHKLAVYDIVDYLKMDIFRPAANDLVDQSGIIAAHKAKFFQQYKHPIDHDILDFCLKARLLIDWLKITPELYENRSFQRTKFSLLENRLQIAFSHSD